MARLHHVFPRLWVSVSFPASDSKAWFIWCFIIITLRLPQLAVWGLWPLQPRFLVMCILYTSSSFFFSFLLFFILAQIMHQIHLQLVIYFTNILTVILNVYTHLVSSCKNVSSGFCQHMILYLYYGTLLVLPGPKKYHHLDLTEQIL